MALDPRFVLAFHFEEYFVDKDTGAPLADGLIKFFRDTARTTPKNVYILSGTPPNYTYVNIGPEVSLNAVGVPTYNNDNIALYFFPYVGDPEDNSTVVDLYYYSVESEGEIEQFTREAQPNVFASTETEIANNNYIPNGQFWLHTDIPATTDNDYTAGKITAPITVVAPGGWTFERPDTSTATDVVTFGLLDSVTSTSPPDTPRYQIQIENQIVGINNDFKDLRVKLGGVNKFLSTTQQYSLVLWGQSNTGNDITVELTLIKNYGTGGSPQTEGPIGPGSITVPAAGELFAVPFVFGSNAGKTIGTDNDDYVALAVRLPGDAVFDILFTDFGLFFGEITDPTFSATTDRQFVYRSIFQDFNLPKPTPTTYFPNLPLNGLPAYDGSSFYLPMVMTPNGIAFDSSEIGDIEMESQINPDVNYDLTTGISKLSNRLLAWGLQYETAGYSPLGIPFARLQEKYFDPGVNIPRYGTGAQYFTATIPNSDNVMLVNNNTAGAFTAAADVSSGFTFKVVSIGSAVYYTKSYLITSTAFYIENLNPGVVSISTVGTSGFTISTIQVGVAALPQITEFITATIANNPGNPGKYFTFHSYNAMSLSFYVWFQVSTETDPAPGGTGIKVNLAIGDSAAIIAQKTRQALMGWQQTLITTIAASGITGGDYFNIYSSTEHYVVWYKVASIGSQPSVPGALYIEVDLPLGTETAAQVASATQLAMNSKYFATPDYRGWMPRAWNDTTGVDPDAATRWTLVPGFVGNGNIGTFQEDQNKQHVHSSVVVDDTGEVSAGGTPNLTTPGATGAEGGAESRPKNFYANFVIKY